MIQLSPVNTAADIPPLYRDTPIGELLEFHNLEKPLEPCATARLLIGMCMDNRKVLRTPDNFAFVIRSGGANLRYSEFKVSFAIGVGGVRAIAVVAHTNCGMTNVMSRRTEFIQGLVSAGWENQQAEEHFNAYAPMFEIGDAATFTLIETQRLRRRYPKVIVCPLMYKVEDNRLYLIGEQE